MPSLSLATRMATFTKPDILPLPVIGLETAWRRIAVIDPSAQIHATADLEADVSIGPGTTMWHHAQIRRGARIGRDAVIGRDVFIDEAVTLGDRVKVQNRALVYHGVTIADGVFIGPGRS